MFSGAGRRRRRHGTVRRELIRVEDRGLASAGPVHSRRLVVTTIAAGGPLEIVRGGQAGIVAEPTGDSLASALRALLANEGQARTLGQNGRTIGASVSWDAAIEKLLDQSIRQ